jgi:hypothetical protein
MFLSNFKFYSITLNKNIIIFSGFCFFLISATGSLVKSLTYKNRMKKIIQNNQLNLSQYSICFLKKIYFDNEDNNKIYESVVNNYPNVDIDSIDEKNKSNLSQISNCDTDSVDENVSINSTKTQDNTTLIKNVSDRSNPMDLCKIYENKGYVFVRNNLGSTGTEINEFIELMRRYDLDVLNGCLDPDNCNCDYRYKKCRIFMMRKYSISSNLEFYSPCCDKLIELNIQETNDKETELYKFINIYQNKIADQVMNIVNYVDFIIDPYRKRNYMVDVMLIADPFYKGYKNYQSNGYGLKIDNDEIDDITMIKPDDQERKSRWHFDMLHIDDGSETIIYDNVSMFILNSSNISRHKLMIGKKENKNVVDLSSICIEDPDSDIGYIIDQGKDLLHKHSKFLHIGNDSKRNTISIKFKYFDD